jgi:hypothetical protein
MPYTPMQQENTKLFAERAREIVEQEIDRAKSLDTKAGAVIAAAIALTAASAAFVLSEQDARTGARTLWAVEIGLGLIALCVAGVAAVWSIAPMVVRSQIGIKELLTWVTPAKLNQEPTLNEGTILNGSLHSIGLSRTANDKKWKRLRVASWALGAGLAAIVALTISVAVNSAQREAGSSDGRSQRHAGHVERTGSAGPERADLPDARNGH